MLVCRTGQEKKTLGSNSFQKFLIKQSQGNTILGIFSLTATCFRAYAMLSLWLSGITSRISKTYVIIIMRISEKFCPLVKWYLDLLALWTLTLNMNMIKVAAPRDSCEKKQIHRQHREPLSSAWCKINRQWMLAIAHIILCEVTLI